MFALVGVGSGAGAFVRWVVVSTASESSETICTVLLNGLGSLLLGLIIGSKQPRAIYRGIGVGFCGGLTTFSSFAVDVAVRLDDGDIAQAMFLLLSTAMCAVALAWGGYRVGRERSRA